MPNVMLTLHYPKGLRGIPIATTTDPGVLRYFKNVVLKEWEERVNDAGDEAEAMIDRLEYHRLKNTLNIFIPEDNEDSCEANEGD